MESEPANDLRSGGRRTYLPNYVQVVHVFHVHTNHMRNLSNPSAVSHISMGIRRKGERIGEVERKDVHDLRAMRV